MPYGMQCQYGEAGKCRLDGKDCLNAVSTWGYKEKDYCFRVKKWFSWVKALPQLGNKA